MNDQLPGGLLIKKWSKFGAIVHLGIKEWGKMYTVPIPYVNNISAQTLCID